MQRVFKKKSFRSNLSQWCYIKGLQHRVYIFKKKKKPGSQYWKVVSAGKMLAGIIQKHNKSKNQHYHRCSISICSFDGASSDHCVSYNEHSRLRSWAPGLSFSPTMGPSKRSHFQLTLQNLLFEKTKESLFLVFAKDVNVLATAVSKPTLKSTAESLQCTLQSFHLHLEVLNKFKKKSNTQQQRDTEWASRQNTVVFGPYRAHAADIIHPCCGKLLRGSAAIRRTYLFEMM